MKTIALVCVLIVLAAHQSIAIKLNYPRVLLPIFEKLSINFTLEVIESGCFKWTSSRPDLISITPIYDDIDRSECTSKATVTTLSREKRRNTAFVLAEDLATGEILRCDVILDVIDQLGVLTTTRELYLEEAPETFELLALDSQGNSFTTLEGIEFNWKISSQTPVDGKDNGNWQQVLRFLRFSESKYHDVPQSVERFDQLGLRGYMVLLEGFNTGSAKVTVRLPHPEYSQVLPIEVNIMVLANIILDPSDVHVLVGDSISFKILQLKLGKLQDITHNTQYYLEVEDTRLATIKGTTVTGHVLGRTSVILKDRNVVQNAQSGAVEIPTIRASVTVSRADKLTVNLLPYYNWVTIEGERHTIGVDLYTNDNQLITLGTAYSVAAAYDEKIFYKISTTDNGTRTYGETLKSGTSPVVGTYERLKASGELQVYKKIDVQPARVVLPYDPNHPKRQKIQYTATGGDGSFVWSSLNTPLITIAQNGLAETKPLTDSNGENGFEFAQVKVAMQRNPKISKLADVLFLPPIKLQIVRYNFETALKDYVFVHVALYADNKGQIEPFTSCDNLQFKYDFADEIFNVDANAKLPAGESLHSSACHLVALRATSLGTSHFRISYTYLDRELHDEVNLVVFDKLDILNPLSNEIVLPIGSSRNVIYQNGPQKVFSLDAELTETIDYNRTIASITPLVSSDYAADKHIFNILCSKIGSTQFTYSTFNKLVASNHQPYVSQFVTNVHCVKPRFINLYTTAKLRESCPLKVKNSLMHVRQDDNRLEIGIEVLDAQNRKLMNISSLVLSWKFGRSDTGNYDEVIDHQQLHDDDTVAGATIPLRDYLLLAVPEIQSSFKIKASVDKYNENVLYAQSISSKLAEFGLNELQQHKSAIENEITFLTVNSTLLPYDSLSVFLALKHRERVRIVQGSGFYDIRVSDPTVARVTYDNDAREIIIEPLQIGQTQIDLIDRCLQTDPSHLFVSVVSIGRIEVKSPDRVERTKSVEAIIRLYDSLDTLLLVDHANLDIYELHDVVFNPNRINVALADDQSNLNLGEIRYIVTGLELGDTKIAFESGQGERFVSSAAVPIQVFPPLRLYPRNSTIIVGSSVQIYSHGGPSPDVNIVYSVQNENIISMDSSVVLAHRLGQSIIVGQCIGINPATGQSIVFSEDRVIVHVVPFDRVEIKTPLIRIRTGAIMPATIWGTPNISPMILGTLNDLKVKWSTNQPDVIDILDIFSEAGVEYEDIDSISVRVRALNPGRAKIQAEVETPNGRQTCAVDVIVFKMLELESPKRITSDAIIVPPNSVVNLKANLPDTSFKFNEESVGGLKISAEGVLRTTEAIGRDLVIATSEDQTLSIPIEVKNIHYVLVTLHSPTIKLKQVERRIPSGMNVVLKVTLHDNMGNEFVRDLQEASPFTNKLSQKEQIAIKFGSNSTVAVNLPRETSTMLSIALRDADSVKYDEDFVKLAVANSKTKFPTKTVFSVGDIICFDSPLVSINNWVSSDESIISIDNQAGIGRVIGSRSKFGEQVAITNGNEQFGYIRYDLEIREADSIEFFRGEDIFNGKNYRGHLVIKNHLQLDKISNLITRNASTCTSSLQSFVDQFFICDLRLLSQNQGNVEKVGSILRVSPTFDRMTGAYACEIESLASISELIALVKNDESSFELIAKLGNGITATSRLRIGIGVYPSEISLEQVDQQIISVTGLDKVLQKVEVTISNTNYLDVTLTSKGHGTYQYKLRALKLLPHDESVFVNVYSPATKQTIQLPIQSSRVIPKCTTQPFQNVSSFFVGIISNIGLIISALLVLAATIWAFIYCLSSSGQQQTDGLRNTASSSSSPTSPSPPAPKQRRKLTPAEIETFSPFQKPKQKPSIQQQHQQQNITNLGATSPPRGPLYPPSPFLDFSRNSDGSPTNSRLNQSGSSSPPYGDATLISPNKRLNRRYL